MKKMMAFTIAVAVPVILVAFQNCGGKFATQDGSSSMASQSSTPPSTVIVTPGSGTGTGGVGSTTGQAQNVQVNPGDPVDLALTLSSPASQDLNFTYQTADDTALSGQHYVATSGSGVIAAGQAVGHIALTTTNNPGLVYLGRDFKVKILIPTITVNQTVSVTFKSGLADVVLKNTWTTVSATGAPPARGSTASVWTGSKILIFGGSNGQAFGDGYSYDPALGKWALLSSVGAPSARMYTAYAWTGSKMIVWGGASSPSAIAPSGAMYDPATDTWKAMSTTGAPAARYWAEFAWTGSKFIVWGGINASGTILNDGAMYDPQTDTWSPMTTVGAPSPRYLVDKTALWTGTKFVVWGGINSGFLAGGALYDPVTNTWEAISATGAPGARSEEAIVWTGTKILVWGGSGALGNGNNGALANGAAYDPATKTWAAMSAVGAPSARSQPSFVWTGSKMIVWGGATNTGAVYDPATDSWSPMAASPLAARTAAATLWTGMQLFVFGGGASAGGYLSDGAVYQ